MMSSVVRNDAEEPSKLKIALILTAVFLGVGLLHFFHYWLDDVTRGKSGTAGVRFIEEMTGTGTGLALVPVVLFVARRFRFNRGEVFRSLGVHVLTAVVGSFIHTTLLFLSRKALFAAFCLGVYNYGYMPVRYFMELPNDCLFYGFFVAGVRMYELHREARERELKAARFEAQLTEARLQALQLQIQPHFLFNTLNTISSTLYEDVRKADEMIVRLADFLRAALGNSHTARVPLEEELRFVKLYLDIQQARFEDRLTVDVRMDEAVRRALVPWLALQPLVENSIKHGGERRTNPLSIRIRAWADKERVFLEVRDNGPGLSGTPAACLSKGTGLANVNERLAHLYGDAARFTLENGADAGLTALIELPLEIDERTSRHVEVSSVFGGRRRAGPPQVDPVSSR